jgi:hypothetical protein
VAHAGESPDAGGEGLLAQHTSEQFSAMHSTNLRAHFVILPSLRQGPQVFHELDKSRMRIARLHDESRMTRRLATCNSLRRGIPIRGTKDRKPSIAHAQRCRHNSREKRGSHIFRRLICLRWQESIASTRREYAFCYHNATTISRQHDNGYIFTLTSEAPTHRRTRPRTPALTPAPFPRTLMHQRWTAPTAKT